MHDERPHKEHKPLFNKTYLKYLVFIVAIAILLLSEKAAEPINQPKPVTNGQSPLHFLETEELHQYRLFLSFVTAPALTSSARIERELSYNALREQAGQSKSVHSILWTFDRLELELRWDKNDSLNIEQALHTLIENSTYDITETKRRLVTASHYLQDKAPDTLLLNTLEKQLSYLFPASTLLSDILSLTPTSLLITDENSSKALVTDIDQQLSLLFPNSKQGLTQTSHWPKSNQTLFSNTKKYKQLIASEIKEQTNLQSQIDLLSHFVLSNILSNQLTKNNFETRLIRKPIYLNGYQVLIITSDQNIPNDIATDFSQEVTLESIKLQLPKVKKRLLNAYKRLTEDKERLFTLYSKKLFYGLETQSFSLYEAQQDTITSEQILESIQLLLAQNRTLLRLQPNK